MVNRTATGFVAKPPLASNPDAWAYTQFLQLQTYIEELENRIARGAGYGGMRITAIRFGADIDGTWRRVAPYDEQTVEPYGCSFDIVEGTFTVETPGAWRLSAFTQVAANQSGQTRSMEFRWVRADTGDQIGSLFFIEVASRIGQLAFTSVYDLTGLVGIPVALEARSPDSFSSVEWTQQNVALDFAGPVAPISNVGALLR